MKRTKVILTAGEYMYIICLLFYYLPKSKTDTTSILSDKWNIVNFIYLFGDLSIMNETIQIIPFIWKYIKMYGL